MNPARPGGCDTNSQFSCEFRVSACHEGGSFLMPCLDESDLVLFLPQRLHDPVDAVARDPEDRVNAPVDQSVNHDFACRLCHSPESPQLRQPAGPNVTRNFGRAWSVYGLLFSPGIVSDQQAVFAGDTAPNRRSLLPNSSKAASKSAS